MADEVIIDGPLFLGMHAADERTRLACKAFFVDNLDRPLVMSLEQVGWCDDVIWRQSRQLQDAYYPFMDNLHTDASIARIPYTQGDLDAANELPDDLSLSDRLLLAMAGNRDTRLVSANPRLLARKGLPVERVPDGAGQVFPAPLEKLYDQSLALRLDTAQWG
jgi:Family of unknown function (DUF6190)